MASKKPVSPVTAAEVIVAEREVTRVAGSRDKTVASWFSAALDARRGKFAADAKGVAALQKEMQGELVAAATAQATLGKRAGGRGMTVAQVEATGTWFKILALVVPENRISTYKAYFSGVAKAHAHGKPWTSHAHNAEQDGGLPPVPWKGSSSTPTEAGVDKGAKAPGEATVTKGAATPETVRSDAVKAVVAAANSPERIAALVNFAKSQGWLV